MFYVDPTFEWNAHGFTHWCHMGTDDHTPKGYAALDAFAARLGLKRAWRDDRCPDHVHYDLTPSKRKLAVRLGAVEVSHGEYGRLCTSGARRNHFLETYERVNTKITQLELF